MEPEEFGGTRRPNGELRQTAFDATCPYCGVVQEVHTSFAGATPKEGDIMICIDCVNVGQYDAELRLVKPSDELLPLILEDEFVQKVRGSIQLAKMFGAKS